MTQYIKKFQQVLDSQSKINVTSLKKIWDESSEVRSLYFGETITFSRNDNAWFVNIRDERIKNDFKKLVLIGASDIYRAIWKRNERLKDWYHGKAVDEKIIPLKELIDNFMYLMQYEGSTITKSLWENNCVLLEWFSCKLIKTPTDSASDYRMLPYDTLLENFITILDPFKPNCTSIANFLWSNNEPLRAWFRGDLLNETCLPESRLIELFTHAAISRSLFILQDIFLSIKIQEAIRKLNTPGSSSYNEKTSINLLQTIIAIPLNPNEENALHFIKRYLDCINNIPLIQKTLETLTKSREGEKEAFSFLGIDILEKYLNDINGIHVTTSTVEITPEYANPDLSPHFSPIINLKRKTEETYSFTTKRLKQGLFSLTEEKLSDSETQVNSFFL